MLVAFRTVVACQFCQLTVLSAVVQLHTALAQQPHTGITRKNPLTTQTNLTNTSSTATAPPSQNPLTRADTASPIPTEEIASPRNPFRRHAEYVEKTDYSLKLLLLLPDFVDFTYSLLYACWFGFSSPSRPIAQRTRPPPKVR